MAAVSLPSVSSAAVVSLASASSASAVSLPCASFAAAASLTCAPSATKTVSTFAKSSEIPKYCAQLAAMLAAQPLFDGYGSVAKTCKVIPLESWDDTRICDIFNRNAVGILGDKAWEIHYFGCGNNQVFDSHGDQIEQGLSLWLYPDKKMCSLESLEDAYNRVLKDLTVGWKRAELEDNRDIMFIGNRDDFALFIKEKPCIEEDNLIRFMAQKFSMNCDVSCNFYFLRPDGPGRYCYNDKIYLWVRKSALNCFAEKFGFKL